MHAVYLFFNEADDLIYIGRTGNLPQRLTSHNRETPWYSQVASITVHQYPTRDEAKAAESELITKGKPWYNTMYNTAVNERRSAVRLGQFVIDGEALRRCRVERGRTVSGLAREVGINQPHLSNLEAGRRRASDTVILALAKALGEPVARITFSALAAS